MSKPRKIALGAVAAGLVAIASCGVYLVLRFTTFYAPSESMMPTVRAGQLFAVDRFAYRNAPPRRGDVVVFTPPVPSGNPFFKRVVAGPGDRFAIRGNRTFLNGKAVADRYAPKELQYELMLRDYDMWIDGARLNHTLAMIPPRARWTAPDAVPRGCYLVLGDNRANSMDSHAFGFFCPGQPVPARPSVHQELLGRALLPSS